MRRSHVLLGLLLLFAPILAHATVFATLHGVVHDPQHRPIAGAQVNLKAADSAFTLNAVTSTIGEFELVQVPIGVYRLEVSAPGFASSAQPSPSPRVPTRSSTFRSPSVPPRSLSPSRLTPVPSHPQTRSLPPP